MEWLAIIAVLAGVVWGACVVLRGGLVAGCLLVLVVGSVFGPFFWSMPTGSFPITADRLLLAAVVGLCLLMRRLGKVDFKPWSTGDKWVAALIALLIASALIHPGTDKTPIPLPRLFIFYAMPLTMYWLMRQTKLDKQQMLWIFGSLALFGVYLGFTAICEVNSIQSLVYPSYISSPTFEEFLGRGRGPFLNPIACGIVLTLAAAATLLLIPHCQLAGKLSLLALAALPLAGLYCSLTRSVWMGTGLMLLLLMACGIPRSWRGLALATAITGCLALVVVQWDNIMVYKRDKDLDANLTAESAALRPILATVAWKMFQDRPLLGCGYGHYFEEKNAYLADRTTDYPLEKVRPYIQHNVFLAMLVENGLVGLAVYLAMLTCWVRDAWRLWRSDAPLWTRQAGLMFLAFLAGWIPNGMFHDVSMQVMINMFLFFMAGTVSSLAPQTARAPLSSPLPAAGFRAMQPA